MVFSLIRSLFQLVMHSLTFTKLRNYQYDRTQGYKYKNKTKYTFGDYGQIKVHFLHLTIDWPVKVTIPLISPPPPPPPPTPFSKECSSSHTGKPVGYLQPLAHTYSQLHLKFTQFWSPLQINTIFCFSHTHRQWLASVGIDLAGSVYPRSHPGVRPTPSRHQNRYAWRSVPACTTGGNISQGENCQQAGITLKQNYLDNILWMIYIFERDAIKMVWKIKEKVWKNSRPSKYFIIGQGVAASLIVTWYSAEWMWFDYTYRAVPFFGGGNPPWIPVLQFATSVSV